jgi:geranylgeranyl diphosphate synthase, type II
LIELLCASAYSEVVTIATSSSSIDSGRVSSAIGSFIDVVLPKTHAIPEIAQLYAMMREYPSRPGKMIRSKLLIASAIAHGAKFEQALPLAAALELFQNWVLIHDDIEDDSDERRGKPALHRLYPTALAINAGDALHIYMWQVVQQAGVTGAFEEFLEMIHRTAEGQQMDLAWVAQARWDVSPSDYLEMVRLKTARYTVVSPLKLGALAAGCAPDERLELAGLDLGVAFQIRDDVLNLEGDFASYGKEIAGDIFEGKRTLMLLHMLERLQPAEKTEVVQILEKPRLQKTTAEVERILVLMRSLGSIDFAQSVASDFETRGLDLLHQALADLPVQAAAFEILETAKSFVTRKT